jgi:hypothetical protein
MTETDVHLAQEEFRDQLVAAGLLIPLGEAGLMGRNGTFEEILTAFGSAVTRAASDFNEVHWHFPPVAPRSLVHRVGYMRSFPDLLGSIHADHPRRNRTRRRLRIGCWHERRGVAACLVLSHLLSA